MTITFYLKHVSQNVIEYWKRFNHFFRFASHCTRWDESEWIIWWLTYPINILQDFCWFKFNKTSQSNYNARCFTMCVRDGSGKSSHESVMENSLDKLVGSRLEQSPWRTSVQHCLLRCHEIFFNMPLLFMLNGIIMVSFEWTCGYVLKHFLRDRIPSSIRRMLMVT